MGGDLWARQVTYAERRQFAAKEKKSPKKPFGHGPGSNQRQGKRDKASVSTGRLVAPLAGTKGG